MLETTLDVMLNPKKPLICVVYHSPYGHTARVANAIAQGASEGQNCDVQCFAVDAVDWDVLDAADTLIFGSPTYLGSVTTGFKQFMDNSSKRWKNRTWQGKLAAGFTNSGGLSGDKLAVLQQLSLFSMQHGMLWCGLPFLPEGSRPEHLNRLSSFLGLMTQSEDAPVTETPPSGDIRTAAVFGQYLAEQTLRLAH